MIRLLTSRTAGAVPGALAVAFKRAFLIMMLFAAAEGAAHGEWAAELVLAVLLGVLLMGVTTSVVSLAWMAMCQAAWCAVWRRWAGYTVRDAVSRHAWGRSSGNPRPIAVGSCRVPVPPLSIAHREGAR